MKGARPLLVLLSLLLAGAAPAGPEAALAEGGRLFAADRIEDAFATFAAGWTGSGTALDGALAYDAGTCALRLGRLPEALLWFRRAEAAAPRDPWVRDGLAAARQAIGEPAGGARRPWQSRGRWAMGAGAGLGWVAFLLVTAARRPPRGLLAVLALLACAAFAAGELLERRGPRPAVLLAACPGGPPAGSEVWVRHLAGRWEVAGRKGTRCPEGAVGLVAP